MTSLVTLARRALSLCETAEAGGTENQLADALEAVEELAGELEERIRRIVEDEGDARQPDRVARRNRRSPGADRAA